MTAPVSRRRVWAYCLVAFFALAILGRFAWSYRPLNETERRLVGTWTFVPFDTDPADSVNCYSLNSNRRYILRDTQSGAEILAGSWSARSGRLRQIDDEDLAHVIAHIFEAVLARENPWTPPTEIRFLEPDIVELSVDGQRFGRLVRRLSE